MPSIFGVWKNGVALRKFRIGAAETGYADPGFRGLLIPQQLIAGPRHQGPGTAHMKKETAHFAEVGFLDPILMVLITGAPLVDGGAVPFKGPLIFIQFENHPPGRGHQGPGDNIVMARAAGQIDHRLTGFAGEILAEKTAPLSFWQTAGRLLQSHRRRQSRRKRHRCRPP